MDVSLVMGIQELAGGAKGKTTRIFSQLETQAKVSGWSKEVKTLIVNAKSQGLAPQFLVYEES